MLRISSSQIKLINKLKTKKYRDQYGLFVIEGRKGIAEALGSSKWNIEYLIVDKKFNVDLLGIGVVKTFVINLEDVNKIKTVKTWPGILAIVHQKKFSIKDFVAGQPIIALENVTDPGNLGTIIRTCDWFGIKNLILSENSVDLYNDKVVRSSMGSIFHINVVESQNFVSDLKYFKSKGYKVNALTLDGEFPKSIESQNNVYLFGNESIGLSNEILALADTRLKIQGYGNAESLNLAVSVGIVLSKLKN